MPKFITKNINIKSNEHYQIDFLVDESFTREEWDALNDEKLNTLEYRQKVANLILNGQVHMRAVELDFIPDLELAEQDPELWEGVPV
tara:strand:- start:121 stop:381 length:261 start_codon:yes stop_codon:yes gene_type:complete